MNRIIVCLILLTVVTAGFAQRGGARHGQGVMGPGQVMRETMAQGLSDGEKTTMQSMYRKWTADEQTVMLKRWGLCMRNAHKPAVNLADKKAYTSHMLSGLNAAEQSTMKKALAKMNSKESAVFAKVAKNCCAYGMKHPQ